MDLDAIKRKLAALRTLSERGATEGEAMAAASAMADLLAKSGLTLADFEGPKTEANSCGTEEFGDATRKRPHDVVRTAPAVAEYFGVRAWLRGSRITFFGFPQDTAAAVAMLSILSVTMEQEWAAYRSAARRTGADTGNGARASFMAGFAARVSVRFKDAKRERAEAERAAGPAAGTSLVIVKEREVSRAFSALNMRLRSGGRRSGGRDSDAHAAGASAGSRANITPTRQQIT